MSVNNNGYWNNLQNNIGRYLLLVITWQEQEEYSQLISEKAVSKLGITKSKLRMRNTQENITELMILTLKNVILPTNIKTNLDNIIRKFGSSQMRTIF